MNTQHKQTGLSILILLSLSLHYSTLYERYHLVCIGPVQCCPVAWNFRQYCLIVLLNTDANMLCGLFDDRKHMDIYLHIHQEYCYLGKQKICLYFSASKCEHLWPSPSNLVNCAKCLHNPSKDVADWSVVADFKSLLNFKKKLGKIWLSQTSLFVDM